jgi:predicted transporter
MVFLMLPINVFCCCDFTAFFAVDFLAAGVFTAEDILSNKKRLLAGLWFLSKKILIPNVAEKNILILVEENKLSCCPKKKILNETKKHTPPPCKLWSVPKYIVCFSF